MFLVGNLLFKGFARGFPPLSHRIGLALFAALCAGALASDKLMLITIDGLATTILCLVAGWEAWSLRRGGAEPA